MTDQPPVPDEGDESQPDSPASEVVPYTTNVPSPPQPTSPVTPPEVVIDRTNAPSSPPPPPSPSPQVVNVSQNIVITQRSSGPGFLTRAIWFVFIGWWLSGLAILAAYFLCLIIIGIPVGFMIFNRLPVILTLRGRTEAQEIEVRDGITYITGGTVKQRPLWVRALWFLFVGWWLGAIYLFIAWLLCVFIITLPIGLILFNRVGAVMTLLRY